MTSTHGNWFRFLIAALGLGAAVTGTTTVWAQGFGPDPFRPYNSQYDPYVYPIGPASPSAGQSGAINGGGIRSANQFQNFLNDLRGPSYSNGERYGIGQPYYRSTVDPALIKHYRPDFQPRAKAERSFEEMQRLINDKYFAYVDEKDPKKRARLLKDYSQGKLWPPVLSRPDEKVQSGCWNLRLDSGLSRSRQPRVERLVGRPHQR